jgi:5'-AMP-activated protein kinase catalytic alpha subunit
LYALLVGSLPFDEETVTLLYRKIEQGNYTIPSTVSPAAADLITRMLQVDPSKRIKIY